MRINKFDKRMSRFCDYPPAHSKPRGFLRGPPKAKQHEHHTFIEEYNSHDLVFSLFLCPPMPANRVFILPTWLPLLSLSSPSTSLSGTG